jgi:hypothetical protein
MCVIREERREALTGVRVGQSSSGEKTLWDADALEVAEGKTGWRVNASAGADPTSSETLCMRVHLLMETWEVFTFSIVSYVGTHREEKTRSR